MRKSNQEIKKIKLLQPVAIIGRDEERDGKISGDNSQEKADVPQSINKAEQRGELKLIRSTLFKEYSARVIRVAIFTWYGTKKMVRTRNERSH